MSIIDQIMANSPLGESSDAALSQDGPNDSGAIDLDQNQNEI